MEGYWTTRDTALHHQLLDLFLVKPRAIFEYARIALRRKNTIADLTGSPLSLVEHYYREIRSNTKLKSYLRLNLKGEPYQGQNFFTTCELYVLCRLLKPQVIVETGVASGYSSAYFLQALADQNSGHLYSVDLSRFVYSYPSQEKEVGWLIPPWLRKRWTLVFGASKNVLEPLLDSLGRLDVFYHDGDHTYSNMMYEFEVALQYTHNFGIILADNIDWNTSFIDFSAKHNLRGRHIHANLGGVLVGGTSRLV